EVVLSTFVLFGPGLGLFRGALAGARAGRVAPEALVATGAVAIWAVSLDGFASDRALFFEIASGAVACALLAGGLERRGPARIARAAGALRGLLPASAQRISCAQRSEQTPGAAETVAVADLQPGDRVRVAAGERVPVDGVVRAGAAVLEDAL